jgi:magnesium transporter
MVPEGAADGRVALGHFIRLSLTEQAALLVELEIGAAARLLDMLVSSHQALLLEQLPDERAGELLGSLAPDDQARLLSTTEPGTRHRLLQLLEPSRRAQTDKLLQHPVESVGRLMTPRYLTLSPDASAAEAIHLVRRCEPEVDTVYSLPVIDHQGRLLGMADLRALLSAPGDRAVSDSLAERVPYLAPHDDQESAVRAMLSAQVLAAPVVDSEGVLLGLVTIDDAMEVLELERDEDMMRGWGSEPLGQPYLSASLLSLARSRATWLLVLALAATLTVNVLQVFESELEQVVTLALFIPLLIGTGGNAGAQATTTVVRALAVGDVNLGDLGRTVWRELRVGILLGGMLGAIALAPVAALYELRMALVVSFTLLGVCAIATTAGSVLPILADRLGRDPAVVSAPFITTLVDATGLLVYFLIARAVFQL